MPLGTIDLSVMFDDMVHYYRRNMVNSLPRGMPTVVDESARSVRNKLDVTQNVM
jgi:hypothetical protein